MTLARLNDLMAEVAARWLSDRGLETRARRRARQDLLDELAERKLIRARHQHHDCYQPRNPEEREPCTCDETFDARTARLEAALRASLREVPA